MRISYDKEADALYIRLLEGPFECRTVQLNADVALNLGPEEQLVGIEILDASALLKQNPELGVDGLKVAA